MQLTKLYVKKTGVAFLLLFTCVLLNQRLLAQTLPLSQKNQPASSTTVMIESQVKGSQEQPNVIYIMPWQGISQPVSINDNQQQVVLPQFKPINPKTFKKQLSRYYQQQQVNNKQ